MFCLLVYACIIIKLLKKVLLIKYVFCVVAEDNTILVAIGENVFVQENVEVTMDCIELINDLKEKGEVNPEITWSKNGLVLSNLSQTNVIITHERRYCTITATQLAVGGELGTDGDYTCKVCSNISDQIGCEQNTSSVMVCGK